MFRAFRPLTGVATTTAIAVIGLLAPTTASANDVEYVGDSGGSAIFSTERRLLDEDLNSREDLYYYNDDSEELFLVSTGPRDDGSGSVRFGGVAGPTSEWVTGVYFETDAGLVGDDTDDAVDVYEWRRNGQTVSLISGSATQGRADIDARFAHANQDLTQVAFETAERLTAGDSDDSTDIYLRYPAGGFQHVSHGPAGGSENGRPARFEAASRNGATIVFSTRERLVAGDANSQPDIYSRGAGQTNLLSPVSPGVDFRVVAAARDASRLILTTSTALLPGDQDSALDAYRLRNGQFEALSFAAEGSDAEIDIELELASAGDTVTTDVIYFSSTEPAAPYKDRDGDGRDVFRTRGVLDDESTPSLVTIGGSDNGTQPIDYVFGGPEVANTSAQLTAGDTDSFVDAYFFGDDEVKLLTPSGPSPDTGPSRSLASGLGGRTAVIDTANRIGGDDPDALPDLFTVHVSFGRVQLPYLLSPSLAPPRNPSPMEFLAVAPRNSGSIYFRTRESLLEQDSDDGGDNDEDIYVHHQGRVQLVTDVRRNPNTPPRTVIVDGPRGDVSDSTPTFVLGPNGSGYTFECRMDGGPWFPCSDGYEHTPSAPLEDGYHRFQARATNELGMADPDYAERIFRVDTTAPTAAVSAQFTTPVTSKRKLRLTLSADEAVEGFECRLDRDRWAECERKVKLKVRKGKHRFQARASDAAGNRQVQPTTVRFRVAKKR